MTEREYQRVALVTGGAVRVGRALSLGLAEDGYDVVLHYRSSHADAKEVSGLVENLGRRCLLVEGDLGEATGPESVMANVRAQAGRLDLLVNNAAGFDARPLQDVDAAAWDEVMDLNVRAPHLLVRAGADLLRASRGSVVNMVDLSAYQAWTEHPAHAVSKAALAHLTRVQARALAPEVRVNAVAPGAVLPPRDYPPARWGSLRRKTPLQRLGTPEDVVRTVLFLARSPFITGQILGVDGGRLLGPTGPPGSHP